LALAGPNQETKKTETKKQKNRKTETKKADREKVGCRSREKVDGVPPASLQQ
jgi:hypothetical protein